MWREKKLFSGECWSDETGLTKGKKMNLFFDHGYVQSYHLGFFSSGKLQGESLTTSAEVC